MTCSIFSDNKLSKLNALNPEELRSITGGGDDKNEVKVSINTNGKGGAIGTIDYSHQFGKVNLGGTYTTDGHSSMGGITAGGALGRNGAWSTQVTHSQTGLNISATGKIRF
jgi:hypothetical protein